MQVLPKALLHEISQATQKSNTALSIFFHHSVRKIHSEESVVHLEAFDNQNQASTHHTYDAVLYTGQPWRDLGLTLGRSQEGQSCAEALRSIPSHSLVVVGLGGYQEEKIPEGFGVLYGEESIDILGVIFVHSTYTNHVKPGHFLYRVMMGGELAPLLHHKSAPELVALAKTRLQELGILSKNAQITFEEVIKWPHYIPLATAHMDEAQKSLWQLEASEPGIFLTGNYTGGPAVADCLEQAEYKAIHMVNYLSGLPASC